MKIQMNGEGYKYPRGEIVSRFFSGKRTSQDIYSVVFLLLWMVSDDEDYSVLNELIYTLDEENFLKFIQVFQGTTITVPTMDEINDAFKALLHYQLRRVEGMSDSETWNKLGMGQSTTEEKHKVRVSSTKIKNLLDKMGSKQEPFDPPHKGFGKYMKNNPTDLIIKYNKNKNKKGKDHGK